MIPPGYTQKEWDALSIEEKKAIRTVYENRKLIVEVKKLISVVPRDVLLQAYATTLCALSQFDRKRAVEAAYGLVNKVDKHFELEEGE
jgi:hypothetical protein